MTDTTQATPATIPAEHRDAMLQFLTTEHARVSGVLADTDATLEQLFIKTHDEAIRQLADQKHRLVGAVGYLEAMIGVHQTAQTAPAPAPAPETAPSA